MKLFTVLAVAMAAFSVHAEFWVSVGSEAYDGHDGIANVGSYSAYYCTVDAAKTMFGSSTSSGISTYFKNSFSVAKQSLIESGTTLASVRWYEDYEEYGAEAYALTPFTDGFGFMLYEADDEQAFQVFDVENDKRGSEGGDSYLAFENSSGGGWQTAPAPAPEPTGALLLLLGTAALAMRRRV